MNWSDNSAGQRTLRHQYPSALLVSVSIEPNILPLDLYVGTRDGQRAQAAETSRLIDSAVAGINDPNTLRLRLRLNDAQVSADDFGGMGHWSSSLHRGVAVELASVCFA